MWLLARLPFRPETPPFHSESLVGMRGGCRPSFDVARAADPAGAQRATVAIRIERIMNPLRALNQYGQSVWLDSISRGLIKGGGLQRLIDEDGLTGVTSNPTIFAKAIGRHH